MEGTLSYLLLPPL